MAEKWVYVTGCDAGFGKLLTKKLDKAGFSIFAGCYLQKSFSELKEECSERVLPVLLDVTNEASVLKAAEFVKDRLGTNGLYAVVNNAGILITPGPVEWTMLESYRKMFEVNVLGTVSVTNSVLPLIRKAQGRIVNVSSLAGRIGLPLQAAYCVSKYGVEAYSDVLRRDMNMFGVRVCIIEPGVFNKTGLYSDWQVGLDRLWSSLNPTLKQDYGEAFYQSCRDKLGNAISKLSNPNPELVPDAMFAALTDPKPKYRYRVGGDSIYTVTILSWCKEWLQDWLLTRNGPASPYTPPASAPPLAIKKAADMYNNGWGYKWLVLILLLLWFYKRR
eukprot:Lithocolla_globosa_v1_NODE_445_length_4026_cov_20.129438.p2 type:complete len:331 gc:universal NODE_445_length_4026_cov_20.129438:1058-66(-)